MDKYISDAYLGGQEHLYFVIFTFTSAKLILYHHMARYIMFDNFNFNFKRLYSTQIYKGKAKTCVLHSNVWRLLLRYMHTACIRATKIIDWMTFILHTIAYDQRNQTSYTDAQNSSRWRTVWIMGHEWFGVKRKYKGSGKSNSVQYKIYKPICRLYEIGGAC